MALNEERLILASGSPRRKQLLAEAGYKFKVVVPTLTEPPSECSVLRPAQQAEALAFFKASAIWERYPESLIIGADTLVAVGGRVLGKPSGPQEARRMLQDLSGSRHLVTTGVAILGPEERRLIASDITWVTMRTILPDEIDAYIACGEWVGKAGAYAIQETADRFVSSIEGSFSNIVGMPMELLEKMIDELRAHPYAHRAV